MNQRQALLGMIKAFPGGWDSMSAAMGMTRDALENRVYERRGQSVSLDLAVQMQKTSGTTLLAQAIATDAGGVFYKLVEPGSVDREELHDKFQELYQELGRLSHQYVEFTSDNHIDKRERSQLEVTADEIHQTVRELVGLMFAIYCPAEVNEAPEGRQA